MTRLSGPTLSGSPLTMGGLPRLALGRSILESITAAATVVAAMVAWSGLVATSANFLFPLAMTAAVLAVIGGIGRSQGLPAVLTLATQAVVGLMLVQFTAIGRLLPTPESLSLLASHWQQALSDSRQYAAPVPDSAPAIYLIFLAVGVVALLVVDVTAQTLRRPALAALPLLALSTLPAGLLAKPPGLFSFVLMASAFLLLLYWHSEDGLDAWSRGEVGDNANVRGRLWGGIALSLGSASIVLALVGALLLPTLGWSVLPGRGNGGTGDGVSVVNPMLDLRRDLSRGEDRPMLYVSGERAPSYLRIAALTLYSDGGWTAGDRKIPRNQNAAGQPLPSPVGLSDQVPRSRVPYAFAATDDFKSTWLALPEIAADVAADGDWRYDRDTMDFIAVDKQLTTALLQWSSTALVPTFTAEELDRTDPSAPRVPRRFLALPANLPGIVSDLAEEVTQGEETDFRKARALQTWFRQAFRYDLSVADSLGSSNRDLEAFLAPDGRVGYCEQFAASMALMARSLDIPARVAVGFLEPRRMSAIDWEFSSHDLHAWPELYLPGSGWVRFEPTPGARSGRPPAYTTQDLPGATATASPTASPSARPTPNRRPTLSPRPQPSTPKATTADQGVSVATLLWTLTGLAGVVVVLALPAVVRRSRRRRRSQGTAEDSWLEWADTTVDWGLTFPRGLSPRQTGDALREQVGESSSKGVATLVSQVEKARYAPPQAADAAGGEDDRRSRAEALQDWEETLRHQARFSQRVRAQWLPRSVFRRRR